MKLNKFYIVLEREIPANSLVNDGVMKIQPAELWLRYVKPDGTYRKTCIKNLTVVPNLPAVSANEKEVMQAAIDYCKTLTKDSDAAELHFFCGRERAEVKENPVTKQPQIAGIAHEPGFGKVAIKWKNHKHATEINPDYEHMDNLHPEAKGFCDCIFGIEKETREGKVKLYPELYRLNQQLLSRKVDQDAKIAIRERIEALTQNKAGVRSQPA